MVRRAPVTDDRGCWWPKQSGMVLLCNPWGTDPVMKDTAVPSCRWHSKRLTAVIFPPLARTTTDGGSGALRTGPHAGAWFSGHKPYWLTIRSASHSDKGFLITSMTFTAQATVVALGPPALPSLKY